MVDAYTKLFELFAKFGFLKKVDSINKNVRSINFGPFALLLAKNIHNEWFRNSVITSDMNMFLYDSQSSNSWQEDCQTSYRHALQVTNDQLPFGLVSSINHVPTVKPGNKLEKPENKLGSQFQISPEGFTNIYRCLIFLNSKESQKYFYRFQRQRKMWWRKFSTDPERFKIVENVCKDEGKERIQICAEFPWATEIIETICNHGCNPLSSFGSMFEAKVGRKKQLPHVIECVSEESPAVMTYLYDAYQQLPNRTFLRLHPTLAPYKAAFVVDCADEKAEELMQLAKYLSLNLRKAELHTLYSPVNQSKKKLDSQFVNNDLIGIPYTVVIKPEALNNGIIGLRSRDTTLQEDVHVSKLTSYMKRILLHQNT